MHIQIQPIPVAPVERIGECDLCGLVDHHLVLDACPSCNQGHNLLPAPAAPSIPDQEIV